MEIKWDLDGQRKYETGVDHGVLYPRTQSGEYRGGVPWNGLVSITESPTGGEPTPQYADNMKYLNMSSKEEFAGTIEAYTYPIEFELCDGTAQPHPGVSVGQQTRRTFGLSYRNLIGNDIDAEDHGEKIHIVYGALASPSEKTRSTMNESPEASTMSWEFSTTPVPVPGLKPSAHLWFDSTTTPQAGLDALKQALYGTAGSEPRLPMPAEIFAMFEGTVQVVVPTQPLFAEATDTLTIPNVAGVQYYIDNAPVEPGDHVLTPGTHFVHATPKAGYQFPPNVDSDWSWDVS